MKFIKSNKTLSDFFYSGWYFVFPIITFFFEGKDRGRNWMIALILSIYLSKIQPFIESQYSYAQLSTISFILILMSILIYFFQYKMDSDKKLIQEQRKLLTDFNEQLEFKIKEKTKELKDLNAKLEQKVEEKVSLIVQKDALLLNQSRQAAMGEMLGMIAHQWRQPLSTITLQIANLKFNTMLGNSNESDIDKALDHITNTATYLADTIDDFQNYFKPNKNLETLSLAMLIEHATNFINPRLTMHKIHLYISDLSDEKITTNINEATQVIINLLNNAIDQLNTIEHEDKKITIHTRCINDICYLHVIDNGGGIDNSIIDKIFDPYFSTKGKNGTGIGLYMSKMIIENKLEGSINVQNTSDGVEFIISLPKILTHTKIQQNGKIDE